MSAALNAAPEPEEMEEPEEAALRRELRLRPIYFPERAAHPDTRACPSWCHYAPDEHEINSGRPFDATHALGSGPSSVVSLYQGDVNPARGSVPRYVTGAHLSYYAHQHGQSDAEIHTMLRANDDALATLGKDGLRLTVTDARELITALTYVVDVLDGRRPPLEVQG